MTVDLPNFSATYSKREHSAYSLCHYAVPLIRSRHMTLDKYFFID